MFPGKVRRIQGGRQMANEAGNSRRYPLGVLFVHGIGEQPMGDTLKSVVDPLVRSLDLWVHGATRCRALSLRQDAALQWAGALPTGADSTAGTDGTDRHAALREQASEMPLSIDWQAAPLPHEVPAPTNATPWGGSAVLRDGQPALAGPGDPTPAHAVLHLQTLDQQYRVTEARALLAESWWARSFVPPSSWALLAWTFKVLPLAFGMHVADIHRRHARQAHDAALPGFRRAGHGLRAILWLLLLAPAVMAALPVQALLTASVLLALLPIRFVQDAMRGLQSALIGTLGDSFLLVASPVSRAMIVAQCKRDLQWLSSQCDQVLLVAHSQGCAVSYLALCEQRPAELTEVTWVGSGLRKLEALRTAERNPRSLGLAWLVGTMPVLMWGLAHDLWARARWDGAGSRVFWLALFTLFFVVGLLHLLKPLRTGATRLWLDTWLGLKLRFWDIYASADPVPNGPLTDAAGNDPLMTPHEVHNLDSFIGDHTSYWRNIEEVMLPLALRVARAMGMPMEQLVEGDDKRLAACTQRRQHRVRWLGVLRTLIGLGGAALVFSRWEPWATAGRSALAQVLGWDLVSDIDIEPLVHALRTLLPELLLWLVLPYAALVLIWSGWESHEQRAWLMRDEPDTWVELAITLGLTVAALAPAGHAAATIVATPLAGPLAMAYVLLAGVFVAIMYVLALKSPQLAFRPRPAPQS